MQRPVGISAPLPGDITHGGSYQIAFNLNPSLDAPFLAHWEDGRVGRIKARAFNHVGVLGPLDHARFIVEQEDWADCLPAYRPCLDTRDIRVQDPIRIWNPYVLGPLGRAVWKQHKIDDWNEFQANTDNKVTSTPGAKPRFTVTDAMRTAFVERMPERHCPPDHNMTSRPADPHRRAEVGITAAHSHSRSSSSWRPYSSQRSSHGGSWDYQRGRR